jgi:hypothetical protein
MQRKTSKIKSRRKSKRKSRRKSRRKSSSKKYTKPNGMTCKEFLSKKIANNTREFNAGTLLSNGRKITSRQQAIAIAYSIVRKSNPRCKL